MFVLYPKIIVFIHLYFPKLSISGTIRAKTKRWRESAHTLLVLLQFAIKENRFIGREYKDIL